MFYCVSIRNVCVLFMYSSNNKYLMLLLIAVFLLNYQLIIECVDVFRDDFSDSDTLNSENWIRIDRNSSNNSECERNIIYQSKRKRVLFYNYEETTGSLLTIHKLFTYF